MFGIFFFLHKDLRRIFTDYGFIGFPLRKEFPLVGYMELFFDIKQSRIRYTFLNLQQEYRNYD